MKFIVKKKCCLGCKVPLKDKNDIVCIHCKPKLPHLYNAQIQKVNDLEVKFARLWTQCQRCQESLHQDVICSNRDCPIFYGRKKIQHDAKEANDVLERFQTW